MDAAFLQRTARTIAGLPATPASVKSTPTHFSGAAPKVWLGLTLNIPGLNIFWFPLLTWVVRQVLLALLKDCIAQARLFCRGCFYLSTVIQNYLLPFLLQMRDELGLNDIEALALHEKSFTARKAALHLSRSELLAGLNDLPKPQNDYQVYQLQYHIYFWLFNCSFFPDIGSGNARGCQRSEWNWGGC